MSNVICPFCNTENTRDAYYCQSCERSLIYGKFISLGNGVLTKGMVWELRPGAQTLGRNLNCDFVVPSNLVADHQLTVTYHKHGFTIENASNRDNCDIDGQKLIGSMPLLNGCTVRIGIEKFSFESIKVDDEAVKKIPDPLTGQLQLMLGIISEFHASLSLQEVFDNAVDAVLRLTRTKRGYAFKQLSVEDENAYTISQSTIRNVLKGNGSIFIEDVMASNVNTDTIRKFNLKSIICLPLVTYSKRTGKKHVMGIIYTDSLMPTGKLPKHCKSTLQMLTEIITSTIMKWRNYEQMDKIIKSQNGVLNVVQGDINSINEQLNFIESKLTDSPDSDEIVAELSAIRGRIQSIGKGLSRLSIS